MAGPRTHLPGPALQKKIGGFDTIFQTKNIQEQWENIDLWLMVELY
jgi:hypothetical protein